MVTELITAVNYFTGDFNQPIKLEILITEAAVDVDSLTVIGFMRIYYYFGYNGGAVLPLRQAYRARTIYENM